MAADYTSSKYSATSATLWACRCCMSVCVTVCSMCACVCVCMSSCLSLLLRHLCSMLIVHSFCCVYTLTPAYTHTDKHTRRQVNKHACITKAVKTLARTNEHGNNISYTVWQPLHTPTHTYAYSMRYMNVCQSKLKASSSDWQRIRHSSSPNIDAITNTHIQMRM